MSVPFTNRYKGKCRGCATFVAARAGVLKRDTGKWFVLCADCARPAGDPGAFDEHAPNRFPAPASNGAQYRDRYERGSSYARFSSGAEVFTNRNGRCEDAPCCGCCS